MQIAEPPITCRGFFKEKWIQIKIDEETSEESQSDKKGDKEGFCQCPDFSWLFGIGGGGMIGHDGWQDRSQPTARQHAVERAHPDEHTVVIMLNDDIDDDAERASSTRIPEGMSRP